MIHPLKAGDDPDIKAQSRRVSRFHGLYHSLENLNLQLEICVTGWLPASSFWSLHLPFGHSYLLKAPESLGPVEAGEGSSFNGF